MRYQLKKRQHLCSEKSISELYRYGNAFMSFPLRVVYKIDKLKEEDDRPIVRVMFAAPKRYFKHAVDRNRYKRLMREAYRLQQGPINEYLQQKGLVMDLAFSAVHNQLPEFIVVKEKINRALQNIIDHI